MSESTKPWSLRRRLLTIAGMASLATLLAGGIAMFWAAKVEDEKLLDARLADLGRTVLSFSEHEIGEILADGRIEMIHLETATTLGERYHYQIWSTDAGKLLLRSHKASGTHPMVPLDVTGFRTVNVDNQEFRVFALRGGTGQMVIQVAERLHERESAIGIVSFYFLLFLVIPFAAIGAVTWWQLNRSLRSINGSARQLSQRSPIDLAPLKGDNPPQELRPMIDAINGLFGRIEAALSLERGFTAVAAHELRSPLAGLRAQAQLAATARSAQERDEALAAVMQGVDRSAQLLNQLLDLARIDSHANTLGPHRTQVDFERVIGHVRANLARDIERRRAQLVVRLDAPRVLAVEWGLSLLMSNLLSNAVHYAPVGSRIEVSTAREGDTVVLTVDDAGPGIPPSQRQRAFDRFERLGRQDTEGVGLGLSIVRSVVESHGATIHLLDSPLGGLRVQVRFASPADPAVPLCERQMDLSSAK